MGLGDQGAIIAPSAASLIGKPEDVVTPNAIGAMSDAFRSGYITAKDIVETAGKRGQTKYKADIAMNQANTAKAQTDLENNALMASAAKARAQQDQAIATLGPQAPMILAAYTNAGASVPMIEDPTIPGVKLPDLKQIAQDLPSLVDWAEKKRKTDTAESKWQMFEKKVTGPHGEEIVQRFHYNPELKSELSEEQWTQRQKPTVPRWTPGWNTLVQQAPGTTQGSAPAATGPVVLPAGQNQQATTPQGTITNSPKMDGLRAQAANKLNSSVAVNGMTDDQIRALVAAPSNAQAFGNAGAAPQSAAGLVQPVGPSPKVELPMPAQLPAGVTSMTAPKANIRETPKVPSEGVKELRLANQASMIAERLAASYADLVKSEPGLVGFLDGRIANWTASRQWNTAVAKFKSNATQILAPLAKGAFNETGVLSDQDISRYQGIIPDLADNPAVGNVKMKELLNVTSQGVANNLNFWKRANYDVSGFEDLMGNLNKTVQTLPGKPVASAAAGGDTVTLPSGKVVDRRGRVVR